jgi:hypothetical protein
MHGARKWLLAAVFAVLAGGAAAFLDSRGLGTAEAQPPVAGDHWRNFDGRWSYWHEGDHRWYYTDGTHWYYHNGLAWVLYPFDKLFGRTGFVHGEYRAPPPEKVVVPRHEIYRRP